MAIIKYILSVVSQWHLSEECGDFVHIWYMYQVPYIAHACKLTFGSVPNFSNYGHFFKYYLGFLMCYLREECVDFIHIWYSNQVPCVADAYKLEYGSLLNCVIVDIFSCFECLV